MNNITVPEISFGLYKATYSAIYTPTVGGVHNVTIYARDAEPEYNTNSTYAGSFSSWGKITGFVQQYPMDITAFGINQTHGFIFTVNVNFTNLGPATAYIVNLTHQEDPLGSLTYNETYKYCGTLYSNQNCSWIFNITVPSKTSPALYTAYTKGSWKNPDLTLNETTNETRIVVSSNPVLEVTPTSLYQVTPHNNKTIVGNFTIISAGNDNILNINTSLVLQNQPGNIVFYCPLCVVTIEPSEKDLLAPGENITSVVDVQVPAGQSPGNYWSYINVSTNNTAEKLVFMNITVPTNSSWNRLPESFGTIIAPPNTNGSIGFINISNIGNVKLQFEVYRGHNYLRIENTSLVPYAFELDRQINRDLSVSWIVPITATQQLWNVSITIISSGSPISRVVNLTLDTRDVPPTINYVNINPLQFEYGYENVSIQANVTDNIAVGNVWANVTPPNGSSFVLPMQNYTKDIYNTTYLTPVAGTHEIRICANDTTSLLNCTSPINITSSDTTIVTIIPNASLINATNVTQEWNQNFVINFSASNIGGSRAYNVSVSINSSNVTVAPTYYNYSIIMKNNSIYNLTTITVLNATQPGIYYVNFSTNWTNLNNTFNSSECYSQSLHRHRSR
jgi:hypothetical protein